MDPIYGNLSDEELLGLARQAGALPSEGPAPDAPYYDMEEPEPAPTTASAPPEHIEMPEEQVDVPSPFPQRTSLGVSQSQRGFSDPKYAAVSRREKDLQADYAAADTRADEIASRDLDVANAPRRGLINAEKAKATAEVDAIVAKGQEALVMQRLQDDFAVEEAKENATAQALANQAKTDYLAALADFRASKVDPGQLWGHMTGGEKFGMLATAFVHDFLGARGINTSAMATFSKAIDRNIDAQIQAIKTKGEVAEGFKSLWWMQRNQSASDAEARTRVRGFLLEGAKQQIIANMSQYEAALASAQGQAAIAKVDEELSKTLIEIYRHADANALALRNQALDKWKAKLQASLESQSLAIRQQLADLEAKKTDQAGAVKIEPIYDPETGKPLWYFQPWIQDTEKVRARQSLEALHALNDDFNDLRALARNAKAVADPIRGTRFADTDQQQFDYLATRLAHNFAKANDERATKEDVQDFLKGMRQKTWLTQGDVDKVIAFTHNTMVRPSMSKIRSVAFDMPQELQEKFGSAATTRPFDASLTESGLTANPPAKTSAEIQKENALKLVEGPQGDEPYTAENTGLEKEHKELVKRYPGLFGKESVNITGPGGMVFGQGERERPIKQFEWGLMQIRDAARRGDKDAIEQLKRIAAPILNPGGAGGMMAVDDPNAAAAAYFLYTLEED